MANNLSDIRERRGPLALCWNTGGFTPAWHVDQVEQGRRLIPSLYFPAYYGQEDLNGDKQVARIQAIAPLLQKMQVLRLPIRLRFNNVGSIFGMAPRLPLSPESIPNSALIWKINPPGTMKTVVDSHGVSTVVDISGLQDTATPDTLASPEFWRLEGVHLGGSRYVAEIANSLTSPSYVIVDENHEPASPETIKFYVDNLAKPKTQPWPNIKWKSQAAIEAISVRMRDRVPTLPSDPWVERVEIHRRYVDQYRAFFEGMKSSMPAAWQHDFFSGAYGTGDKNPIPPQVESITGPIIMIGAEAFDVAGPNFYLGYSGSPSDLTDPANLTFARAGLPGFAFQRSKNSRFIPKLFVSITGPKQALAGLLADKHEFVDADVWQGLMTWLAWQNRPDDGGPLLLDYWIGNATTPASKVFGDPDEPAPVGATEEKMKAWADRVADAVDFRTQLANIGRSDLAETTLHGQYVEATARACDSVGDDADRMGFWEHGTAVPVTYPAGPVKIWLSVLTWNGRTMVHAFAPCKFDAPQSVDIPGVGPVSLDFSSGKYSIYWVSAPPVPPKTPFEIWWESIGSPGERDFAEKYYTIRKAEGSIP